MSDEPDQTWQADSGIWGVTRPAVPYLTRFPHSTSPDWKITTLYWLPTDPQPTRWQRLTGRIKRLVHPKKES